MQTIGFEGFISPPSSLCHLAYYRLRFLALAAIAVGVNEYIGYPSISD